MHMRMDHVLRHEFSWHMLNLNSLSNFPLRYAFFISTALQSSEATFSICPIPPTKLRDMPQLRFGAYSPIVDET